MIFGLGLANKSLGNNNKAAELYEKGLDIMTNSFPENRPVIGLMLI